MEILWCVGWKKFKLWAWKIENLEKILTDIDVRLEDNNQNDLVNKLDFHSSLITAKATILSVIERKESRGAHQEVILVKLRIITI